MWSTTRITRMGFIPAFLLVVAMAATALRGAEPAPVQAAPSQPQAEAPYRVTGPARHQNLAVYLIHGKPTSDAHYITLQEGLTSGNVRVNEKGDSQTGELAIENRSQQPVFIQEGDRLQGGKQDRTCYTSLVVKPGSGAVSLAAFCIEHDRWTAGPSGDRFGSTTAYALAPQSVRVAAKVQKNQEAVWRNVSETKQQLSASFQAASTTSSLNEALDSPRTAAAVKGYVEALSKLAAGDDVIGVAIAVGEQIEEVNIYANHDLLSKLYPKLIECYAADAAARIDVPNRKAADVNSAAAAPPAPEAVLVFMSAADAKPVRDEAVSAGNRLKIENLGGRFRCTTECDGTPVHTQWLRDVIRGIPAGAAPALQLPPGRLIVPFESR